MPYIKPMVTIELAEYEELQKLKKLTPNAEMMQELDVYKKFIKCFAAAKGDINAAQMRMRLIYNTEVNFYAGAWGYEVSDQTHEPLLYHIKPNK